VLTGRALERLDDAMDLVDSKLTTVIVNTWVAFYLSLEEQLAYFNNVIARCAKGNVAWISLESTLVNVPGIDVEESAHHRGASQVVVAAPGRPPTRWGWCHAHGRWLERVTTS
jgi:hypothetical protein